MGTKRCDRWEDEESKLCLELRSKGVSNQEIARVLNVKFGHERTDGAISAYVSTATKAPGVFPSFFKSTMKRGVAEAAQQYHDLIYAPCVTKRNELIYRTLEGQAKFLEQLDSREDPGISKYRGMELSQIFRLPDEERRKVIAALQTGPVVEQLDAGLDLLMVPDYKEKNRVSLAMPLYSVQMGSWGENGMRASLLRAALDVFVGKSILGPVGKGKDFLGSWEELVRYNFTCLNREAITLTGQDITRALREKTKKVGDIKISVYVDNPEFRLLDYNRPIS